MKYQGQLSYCEQTAANDAHYMLSNFRNEWGFNQGFINPMKKAARLLGSMSGAGAPLFYSDLVQAAYDSAMQATSSGDNFERYVKSVAAILARKGLGRIGSQIAGLEGVTDVDAAADLINESIRKNTTLKTYLESAWRYLYSEQPIERIDTLTRWNYGNSCKTEMDAWWDKPNHYVYANFNTSCDCAAAGGKINFTPIKRGHVMLRGRVELAVEDEKPVYKVSLEKSSIQGECCDGSPFNIIDEVPRPASAEEKRLEKEAAAERKRQQEELRALAQAKLETKTNCNKTYSEHLAVLEAEHDKHLTRIRDHSARAINQAEKDHAARSKDYQEQLRNASRASALVDMERDPAASACEQLNQEIDKLSGDIREALQRQQEHEQRRGRCMQVSGADCSYIEADIQAAIREVAQAIAERDAMKKQLANCKTGFKDIKAKLPALEQSREAAWAALMKAKTALRDAKQAREKLLKQLDLAYQEKLQLLSRLLVDCLNTGSWPGMASSMVLGPFLPGPAGVQQPLPSPVRIEPVKQGETLAQCEFGQPKVTGAGTRSLVDFPTNISLPGGIKDQFTYTTDRGVLYSLGFNGEATSIYAHFRQQLPAQGWVILKETTVELPQFKTTSANMFFANETTCAWLSVAPGPYNSAVSIGIEKPE
jgi:hypothetical protein